MIAPKAKGTFKSKKPSEEHWIPLSDLMTGLMMMFMLIALLFMLEAQAKTQQAEAQAKKVKQIAVIYYDMRDKIFNDLNHEFKDDLHRWGATLNKDLAISFKEPEVLFESQKAEIRPKFMEILRDFFPRYVSIINKPDYRNNIDEIRIEGHTSSIWENSALKDPYMLNMELSQARTRSVLQYAITLPKVAPQQDWLKAKLTANGLSSSKHILNEDGSENLDASRRVEFRVRTNAEEKISEILRATK
jgi:outer membrane protein OmpA-like peptidoglycan-associated protein